MPDAAVSSQITDSITQVNTKVLGDAPAIAMGNLFIATSQALGNAAHNATNSQQQTNITSQAATTMAVATMLSLDTASTGKATGAGIASPATALLATPADATPTLEGQNLSAAAYRAALESTDPMLSLMVLDAGALAILDAVTHLQRTAIVAETATAMALSRAVVEPDQATWKEVLQAAEQSVAQAAEHLETIGKLAIALHREARG